MKTAQLEIQSVKTNNKTGKQYKKWDFIGWTVLPNLATTPHEIKGKYAIVKKDNGTLERYDLSAIVEENTTEEETTQSNEVSEIDVFFTIAKTVRKEQDKRKHYNEYYTTHNQSVKPKPTNAYIHIPMDDVLYSSELKGKATPKQIYAIAYKLQEKGLIKIHKGYAGKSSGRTTKVSLETKGIDYIKSLKA